MNARRYLCLVLLGFVAFGCAPRESSTPPDTGGATLHIRYFHRTIRCPSCEKIETLTHKAVADGFADDLAAGRLQWNSINIDEAPNKHFEDDYRLQTQTLVISEMRGGKETRWKPLEKIWDMLSDDAAFVRYVQEEVRRFKDNPEGNGLGKT